MYEHVTSDGPKMSPRGPPAAGVPAYSRGRTRMRTPRSPRTGKRRVCTFFSGRNGCKSGNGCRFSHNHSAKSSPRFRTVSGSRSHSPGGTRRFRRSPGGKSKIFSRSPGGTRRPPRSPRRGRSQTPSRSPGGSRKFTPRGTRILSRDRKTNAYGFTAAACTASARGRPKS